MKIAYFSPLNPIKSGVSDYSEELLEYLAGFGRIDLFIDDYRPSSSWLFDCFRIRGYREIYDNHGSNDHDIHVYHVGNNDIHSYIYGVSQEYPGLVVLHEPMLHHFVFSQTVGNNRVREYLRELDYCYKTDRARIVKTTLEDRDEGSWYDYPLLDRIVDSSLGVIVHSDFAAAKVLEANPQARLRKIPHHYSPPAANHMRSPELVREILGFRPDDFLVGSLGYMTSSKRIDILLGAVASVKGMGYPIKLLLVGKMLPGCEAPRWIEELDLDGDVLVTGFVDTRTFREYLNVPDMFVALRHPSAGETSGSVIKMMGAGSPVMVSDHYAFSEFPDDCCVKITTGEAEQDQLVEKLVYYCENADERRELGGRSRRYILANHDIQDSARQYVEFATEVLSCK
ncbi:MAG: glycosyltransferase family 4 protein [Actinobacteria bacterium]|nr:glycosyltransferase family 4 protein [Actinomycetota bacterium]MBU1942439.1 glycosyltransferase family 4 protein [Actinomycetota bacterium]MBU2686311.1 glycosyltransferase family 4 protein [Actinomycetota bacterium]